MKLKLLLLSVFFFIFFTVFSNPNANYSNLWALRSVKTVEAHALNMLENVLSQKKLPRSNERGLQPPSDWTSGFFPGVLWYLYECTNDDFWKINADSVTGFLYGQQYEKSHHDIGFQIECSYGRGYILTHSSTYKSVIIETANSLCSRYNSTTKAIQSWNIDDNSLKKRDWKFPVIIDNMMNLELLFHATELSGDNKYTEIAINHALTTMKNHFRSDFSCPHVVDYDPETGKMRKFDYNNGYNDPKIAAWSRGQAWALYGFTLMYRETKDEKFLKFAENIASYILNNPNMPEDMIPYWDYNSPKIPTMRDASAAAINASALLELSQYSKNKEKYFRAAEKTLKSLSSKKYLAQPGTNGNFALMSATGNYLSGSEVDNSLSYADYYFIEALCRYLKIEKLLCQK